MKAIFFKKLETIVFCSIIVLGAVGTAHFKSKLRKIETEQKLELSDKSSLYLPKAEFIRTISFGYEKFFSDIIWFKTINYFGKHASKNQSIPWFAHMCDLVTELNPRARSHYDFCSSLLSWIAKDPKSSIKLLNRAIAHEPDYWRYYYLRGFNYWYFLENNSRAKHDFAAGAKTKDAPLFLSNLASRLFATEQDPSQAIEFLKNLVEQTSDEQAKKSLEENLKLAYVSRDLKALNQLAEKFAQRKGENIKSLKDLLDEKLINYIPKDIYGDEYYLNENNEIVSLKGKKGLHFGGKTAKTGLARFEK